MFKIPITELQNKGLQIRRDLIDLLFRTGSGHLDTSLSLVEIWLGLVYSDFFQLNPHDGAWEGRDRIFLSEGHACPLQYLMNADLGYHKKDEVFEGLRKPHTPFQGHSLRNLAVGIENSNGSLGIGLWQAYGHALETDRKVFCIAIALFTAPHNVKLAANFTVILNNNHLAQDSEVDIGPLPEMASLYGWQVQRIDGHDLEALGEAYNAAVSETTKPSLIVCDTVKGKGGDPTRMAKLGSHGRPPQNDEEYHAYIDGLERV